MKINEFYSKIKDFHENPEKYSQIFNRYGTHFNEKDFVLQPPDETKKIVISSGIPGQYAAKFSLVEDGETLEVSYEVLAEPFSKYFPKLSILMMIIMDLFDYCKSLEEKSNGKI
jgi:hypothetical protein